MLQGIHVFFVYMNRESTKAYPSAGDTKLALSTGGNYSRQVMSTAQIKDGKPSIHWNYYVTWNLRLLYIYGREEIVLWSAQIRKVKNHETVGGTTLQRFHVFFVYMNREERKPTTINLTVVEPVPSWYPLLWGYSI